MCGIVGYIGKDIAQKAVIEGLKMLEYRGYDSAGIALQQNNDILIFKDKGRVEHLESLLTKELKSDIAIGHTRWATHGKPNKINAHPHVSNSGRFVLVHNGVIDNYRLLKLNELSNYSFYSETDSEVIVNLIEYFSIKYNDVLKAIRYVMTKLNGSYALLILDKNDNNKIYFAKNKAPLLIGIGINEMYIASDITPFIGHCKTYCVLDNHTYGILNQNDFAIFDINGVAIEKTVNDLNISSKDVSKGHYSHYMLKEICEQPSVIRNLILNYFDENDSIKIDQKIIDSIKKCDKINFVGCGTSMNASYFAKYYFEKFCNIPCEVFVASELVYSTPLIKDNPIFIFISQSGETADSIAVMSNVKKQGYLVLAITNTEISSMTALADFNLNMFAGQEIAVASTKAYIASIITCLILAEKVSGRKTNLKQNLNKVSLAIENVIDNKQIIKDIAYEIKDSHSLFFIGRGLDYWTCLEASLKLKEISYIHTEAFSSGELKHGAMALIDEGVPVIAICTQENTNAIVRSNLIETKARGSKGYIISCELLASLDDAFVLEDVTHYLFPLVSVVACQLLAYYTAVLKGNDVDKPKNLAKSVTVE